MIGHTLPAFIKNKPDEAFAILKKRFPTLDEPLLKASFEELRKVTPSPPVVRILSWQKEKQPISPKEPVMRPL